ncbi:MAG: carboxylesterase family protein, partial [Sphingopyxis sp.]
YAMSDLVLGLRWVNENIASFGGDPANVTLMGCSAGSYMSSFLMASPHAKGLFHRVIAESGAKFSPGLNATLAPLSESEERGLSFARRLGASNLAELRAMSADTIVATQQATGSGDMALPGTDGYWLPLDTYTAAEKGYYADVPLLTGSSLNEATIFPTTWKPLATPEAMRALAEKEAPGNAPEFFRYYPANTPAEALRSAVNWSTDVGFAHGNYALAKINTERGQPTYVFRNALPAAGELAKRAGGAFPPEMMRGMHCGENIYAFGNLERGQGKLSGDAITEADRELQDLLTSYWTNFAKTGNPNGGSLPHWPRYDLERMEALTIDKPAQVQRAPDGERLRFFDQLTEERRKRETAQK